jgi:tetratricopeptide (TPR) repeat protein
MLSTLALAALLAGPEAGAQAVKSDEVAQQDRAQAREHYRLGLQKMQSNSFSEAEEEFRAAVKQDRLFVLAYYELGQAQMALKEYPAAVETMEGCIAVNKELIQLDQANRGVAEKRLDDEIQELKDSLRSFQGGAYSAQPGNQVLRLEARLQELEAQRRRGGASMDIPAEFSLALGSAYLRSGKTAEAERAYGEAIRVNPKMGEAHNNLAFIYFSTGRLDEAEKELKAAEKSGFAVNPRFKEDLKKKQKEAAATP